jgi:hypothetical protein
MPNSNIFKVMNKYQKVSRTRVKMFDQKKDGGFARETSFVVKTTLE